MLAPLRAAASVVLLPALLFLGGFWAGAKHQASRSLTAENTALVAQARVVEEMFQEAARRAAERRETIETLQQELAAYEAELDGACRLDDADADRLRRF